MATPGARDGDSTKPQPEPEPSESTRNSDGNGRARDRRGFPLALALRASLREGYRGADLRRDILAGCVVGVVALPLSMALAIASGVPPQHGLYTAIIAGAVVALLGGSRTQVSGPTAAFVVILLPIVNQFGLGGLLIATLMAGAMMVLMGAFGLGRLIQFVPLPVVTGFTSGIAFTIAALQLKDFLGLQFKSPVESIERLGALAEHIPDARWPDATIGLLTLAILILWPKFVTRKIPAALIALPLVAALAHLLTSLSPEFAVATISSQFTYVLDGVTHNGIPSLPPMPTLPWELGGPDGAPLVVDIKLLRALFMPAIAIAMLGAIESLLSAVVADGMVKTKHDPDGELIAQGVGNMLVPFFGGIAATGAIARTATNIRAGGRSPIAAFAHALIVLAGMTLLAPLLGYLPMASLAGLLMLVAWNMSDARHFVRLVRVAPRGDVFTLLACFTLTVVFDMVVSITFGVIMAALLFMRRMAEVSGTVLVASDRADLPRALPDGVLIYEIAGPLFFGAAQKAMGALDAIGQGLHVVVLDMRAVPVMDATGLFNLKSALARLRRLNVKVILSGVQPQPMKLLRRAGYEDEPGRFRLCAKVEDALATAAAFVEQAPLTGKATQHAKSATPDETAK